MKLTHKLQISKRGILKSQPTKTSRVRSLLLRCCKIFLLASRNYFGEIMDYDFRTRSGLPYDAQIPMYRPSASISSSPATHPSLYPKVAGQQHAHAAVPPVSRPSPYNQTSAPSSCTSLHLASALIL